MEEHWKAKIIDVKKMGGGEISAPVEIPSSTKMFR